MVSDPSEKIITDLNQFTATLDRKNQTIVFTNGCFDLLHKGHLHLLEEAKKLGDIVIVGINSDASVKLLKGESRPVESLKIRVKNLAKVDAVDFIIPFSEETPLLLIQILKPDALVKGGDYKKEEIIGNTIAGSTIIIPILKGYSTTKILQNKNKNKK